MSSSGKVAIVTGAAQGLGKAFCEILLQNGAKVALTDFNADQGMKTLSEFETKYGQNKVMFMKCDVTSKDEMSETFETVKDRLGGLDIVINNAGVGFEMGDMWEKTVDVNVKNPEVVANGIRINVLAPAFADTPMFVSLQDKSSIHVPAIADKIKERVGVMTPESVAEAMFELVDDQNKHGAILKVAKATGKEYHNM